MQVALSIIFEDKEVNFATLTCNDISSIPFLANKEYQLGFLRSKAMEYGDCYIYNIQWCLNYGVDPNILVELTNPISSLTTKKAYYSGTLLKSVVFAKIINK